jgi:uncharacterized membrane protein YbhN (UPF0104 family)
MRRFGRLALQVGVGSAISIVCLLLVLRVVDIDQVGTILSQTTFPLVLVAVAAIMVDVLLRAWRWRVLVAPLAAVPLGRVTVYLLLGYLANNVLPARAGELVRSHYLGDREGASRVSVLGTVLVERILDVVALLLISVAAWWLTGAAPRLAGLLTFGLAGGAAAAALLAAVVVLPGRDRILPWLGARLPVAATAIGGRLRAGLLVVGDPLTLVFSIVLTLCAWATTAVVFAAGAGAIGFEISPAQVLLIAAATNLATAMPSAPGYVGTFEFAVVATAGAVGLAPAPALAMGVLVHAAILLTTMVGGLTAFYFATYRGRLRVSTPIIASDDPEIEGDRARRWPTD